MNQFADRASCPRLTLVVPCCNEVQVLPETAKRLVALLDELTQAELIAEPSIYFIDDGSRDGTWRVIELLASENPMIHGLKLSRNFGQQSAILAGLLTARGDALISIDADLQDDVAAIQEMVLAYSHGAEIVYGVRRNRKTDSFFKRTTAEGFYRLLQAMGVELMFNHADYRLQSRRVVEELRNCKESNLLLRGLIPQLGFPSSVVYYDRHERPAGWRRRLVCLWRESARGAAAALLGRTAGATDSFPQAAPLPEWASFDSSYTNTPQEYAGWGAGLFVEPALKVTFADGNRDLVLHYQSHTAGEWLRRGAERHFAADLMSRCITRWTRRAGFWRARRPSRTAASAAGDRGAGCRRGVGAAAGHYTLNYLTGRWAGEWNLTQEPVHPGARVIESRRGSTGAPGQSVVRHSGRRRPDEDTARCGLARWAGAARGASPSSRTSWTRCA
jgi:hypothetical protein